jgi:hypothetical protein
MSWASSGRGSRGDVGRTFRISLAFIVAKSLLASKQSKDLTQRLFGPRARNGLYRPFYFIFSGVGAFLLVRMVYKEPYGVIYEVRPPFSWLMRAGQVACLLATLEATRIIGPGFFGGPQLKAFLTGGRPQAEPEAQGPPLERSGELSHRTVFGLTRHPNNWFPTSIFLLEPRMTDKRAVFCALTALHGLVGSVHEEYRLRAQYGADTYDRYAKVAPFLFSRRSLGRS